MQYGYRFIRSILLLSYSIAVLSGCGRYGKPMAPEFFSPAAVQNLKAEALIEGIKIFWEAPDSDFRGKELKSLDGFMVLRKELKSKEEPDFEEVGIVEDTHIEILRKLKQEARDEGKPVRKIKIDQALKKLEYLDQDLVPGSIYLYKIVPFNQGDVKGAVKQQIRVIFRGDNSEIEIFNQSGEGQEDLESLVEGDVEARPF